jgi:hypothetical protein
MRKNNGWGGMIDMASTIFHKQGFELDGCGQQTGMSDVFYGHDTGLDKEWPTHYGRVSLDEALGHLRSGMTIINNRFKSGLKMSKEGISVLYVSFIEKINENDLAYEVYRFIGGMPLSGKLLDDNRTELSKNTN